MPVETVITNYTSSSNVEGREMPSTLARLMDVEKEKMEPENPGVRQWLNESHKIGTASSASTATINNSPCRHLGSHGLRVATLIRENRREMHGGPAESSRGNQPCPGGRTWP